MRRMNNECLAEQPDAYGSRHMQNLDDRREIDAIRPKEFKPWFKRYLFYDDVEDRNPATGASAACGPAVIDLVPRKRRCPLDLQAEDIFNLGCCGGRHLEVPDEGNL